MQNVLRAVTVAGAASLLATSLAFAQPTDAEFKCEQAVSKFGAKFVSAKAKCVDKCLKNFWKGLVPESDCLPPYGGTTLSACITDTVLGEGVPRQFRTAIRRRDPGFRPVRIVPNATTVVTAAPLGSRATRYRTSRARSTASCRAWRASGAAPTGRAEVPVEHGQGALEAGGSASSSATTSARRTSSRA
jgi:hypothetical protein